MKTTLLKDQAPVIPPLPVNNLRFTRLDKLGGWVIFALALLTYTITVEPTASFWDCGEFIAVSYKLEVPHPPGAPFFLLLGRLFSFLSFGDVTKVAFWVNMMSVVASAATVMFTFWIITLLGRKALKADDDRYLTRSQTIALLGAGAVGALACCFSDSFWFSAVEAEVYAMSSFFTAFVVWAMLRWERIADQDAANRWLILIAYMVGLSIGVHLLNLVALPAVALLYYFKKYTPTLQGGILAVLAGAAVLVLINNIIIPGLPSVAGWFEIQFVNSLGLPFSSGILFFIALVVGALVYGIRYSVRTRNPLLNTGLLSLAFVLIGYCSYALIVIRANENPPINENNPRDILSFVYYLKREQYGDRPLLVGYDYTAEVVAYEKGEPVYRKGKDKYEVYDNRSTPKYAPESRKVLFPRMHSRVDDHVQRYQNWANISEGARPTMGDNLTFLAKYQLGHMYARYFMWNFAGRASDIESAGWLKPFDTTHNLPESLATNRGRNQFYMLPFLLGLLGLFYHYGKNRRDFLVTALLFFLTGIALVLYLNSPPVEPRERDYIYVGSYWTFCLWIGLGVLALAELLEKLIKNARLRAGVATGLGLLVPGVMLAGGFDDHNRANRFYSVDSAKNLLNSCAPNAILFTGGDNDTFPLWYVQEVEGFRTDVRVCNLSLLGTHWYIDQMRRRTYASDALPISIPQELYAGSRNDQIPYFENPEVKNGINLAQYIKLVSQDSPALKVPLQSGETITSLPSQNLFLPVDSAAVVRSGIVPTSLLPLVSSQVAWKLSRGYLLKPDLIMLDMLVTNNWKRPIYFSSTLAPSNYLDLREYMQIEGLAYRLLPVKVPGAKAGFINTDLMYDNLMNKMFWRQVDNPDVYYDDNYRTRSFVNVRLSFARLAEQLISEGKKDKARTALLHCLRVIPDVSVPYDEVTAGFVQPLLQVGEKTKALEIAATMARRADQNLTYYLDGKNKTDDRDVQTNLYVLNELVKSLRAEKQEGAAKQYEVLFNKHYDKVK